MQSEFVATDQRSIGKKIFHRILGLVIWGGVIFFLIELLISGRFWGWQIVYLIVLFVFAYVLIRFTLVEPDKIVIDEEAITFIAGNRPRAVFRAPDIEMVVDDGTAISITASGQRSIIGNRHYHPYDWTILKTSIINLAPEGTVRTTDRKRRLDRTRRPTE